MTENLYLVVNRSRVDVTRGLVRISDDDFPRFKTFIENLNKNSHCSDQPVILVYKITMDVLKEIKYDPSALPWERGYVDIEEVFYLDDKEYTFKDENFLCFNELELAISGKGD